MRHVTRASINEDWLDRFYALVFKTDPKHKVDEAEAQRLCRNGYSPADAATRYLESKA